MKCEINSESVDHKFRNVVAAETLLKQLANANRLMILCTLISGEKTVKTICEEVNLSQSAISQHLAKMKEAGILKSNRNGQQVYYAIASMEVQALLSVLYFMYCKS